MPEFHPDFGRVAFWLPAFSLSAVAEKRHERHGKPDTPPPDNPEVCLPRLGRAREWSERYRIKLEIHGQIQLCRVKQRAVLAEFHYSVERIFKASLA
jgi:hypothetical protein